MSLTPPCSVFASLHAQAPGFVMPNAWDAGSAILLASAGFPAIATTSAGIAFSLGKPDYHVAEQAHRLGVDAMFQRVEDIARAVSIPVSADLEAGYGDSPEQVAITVRRAIDVGLAGGNIEDRQPGGGLYDETLAVERILAAREAIEGRASGFVLTARTDAFFTSEDPLPMAITRANRYRDAGAHCLYAPGADGMDTIRTLVQEVEGPVNVVVGLDSTALRVEPLLAAGVQRISLGGSLARAALAFVRKAAIELHTHGRLDYAAAQIPQAELNTLFTRALASRSQAT